MAKRVKKGDITKCSECGESLRKDRINHHIEKRHSEKERNNKFEVSINGQ